MLIGEDLIASTGTRSLINSPMNDEEEEEFEFQTDTILELLWTYENPHRNENGEGFLNLMREHDLRAVSTYLF